LDVKIEREREAFRRPEIISGGGTMKGKMAGCPNTLWRGERIFVKFFVFKFDQRRDETRDDKAR
jgi:hypothetical protein